MGWQYEGQTARQLWGRNSQAQLSVPVWICVLFLLLASAQAVRAASQAPGQPGAMGTWARADKQGYGTTLFRPVWFTLVNGALSEITYPTVELMQTRDSFLIVRDLMQLHRPPVSVPQTYVDERKGCSHETKRRAGTLAFSVKSFCPGMTIQKEFLVAPDLDAVVAEYEVQFEKSGSRELIFVHNAAAASTPGGDGMHAITEPSGQVVLLASQSDIRGDEPSFLYASSAQRVAWSLVPSQATVGFEGVSAPEDQLRNGLWPQFYDSALNGNVAGALIHQTQDQTVRFRVMILFSPNLETTHVAKNQSVLFRTPLHELLKEQTAQWSRYLRRLDYDRQDALAEASILVIKALEDKTQPGALIAGPGFPWLPVALEAPEMNYEESRIRAGDSNAGYRRVWPRDLYHKALALLAVRDIETPKNILRWYRQVQRTDGTWSQNMFLDGRPSWKDFQIDQTGFPITLAWRVASLGQIAYPEYREMVRRAAHAIMTRGPGTGQERWEELGGLSPNSLAVVVEALRAAAELEKMPGGDSQMALKFKRVADSWAQSMKSWLVIPDGAFGKRYIARIELGRTGGWDPSFHESFTVANKADGMRSLFREDEIIDGGFLQWILAGLMDPHDQDLSNSLALYDLHVRKKTDAGLGYRRYNEDAYGEMYQGGAWPILSVERAIAAIERGESELVRQNFDYVRRSASSANVICEQDTLSVCPLGWSHAAYLILLRSNQEGRSFYR